MSLPHRSGGPVGRSIGFRFRITFPVFAVHVCVYMCVTAVIRSHTRTQQVYVHTLMTAMVTRLVEACVRLVSDINRCVTAVNVAVSGPFNRFIPVGLRASLFLYFSTAHITNVEPTNHGVEHSACRSMCFFSSCFSAGSGPVRTDFVTRSQGRSEKQHRPRQ